MQTVFSALASDHEFDYTSFVSIVKGLTQIEVDELVLQLPNVAALRRKYKPSMDSSNSINANQTREALKVNGYMKHIILQLSIGFTQNNKLDPLPLAVIHTIIVLLQDISFLIDPMNNGVASFMERVLVENFLDQMPETLKEIYSGLEISKPKKLKECFVDARNYRKTEVHIQAVVSEAGSAPKRRKVENGVSCKPALPTPADKNNISTNNNAPGSALTQYLSTQISQKSLNHFSSRLCDMKSLFGKQFEVAEKNGALVDTKKEGYTKKQTFCEYQ